MVGASLASPLDPQVIVQRYKFIGYFCMFLKCFLKDTNVKAKLEVSDLFEKIQIPSGWLHWRPYISMYFFCRGIGEGMAGEVIDAGMDEEKIAWTEDLPIRNYH